ncbi:MAG: DUF5701 family protein [Patescibacteria group bacterium]|nr:DUF5701 family protein [Patescibacteria group bacterium]
MSRGQGNEILNKLEAAGLDGKLAQKIIDSKGNKLGKEIVDLVALSGSKGVLVSQASSEVKVRETQIKRLLECNVHKALNMSEEEFRNRVPLPENRPNALLIIDILDCEKGMKCANGINRLSLAELEDVVILRKLAFYWIYEVENGKKMLGKSPDQCVEIFKKQGRRGLTAREGCFLLIQNPYVLEDHFIDLPGSRYDSGFVPCLDLDVGRPELDSRYSFYSYSRYGSASCGS